MELIGDEKRIQALFSELQIEDARMAPRFSMLLNRVASRTKRLNLALASAFAALVCAMAVVASWEVSRRYRTAPGAEKVTEGPIVSVKSTAQTDQTTIPKTLSLNSRPSFRTLPNGRVSAFLTRVNRTQRTAKRLAARELAADKNLVNEAKAISSWTSPTNTLLSSSTGEVLTTLPQLNQSATQLKAFLPNTSN